MKEANNNEVDLLLRALAGRRKTVPLPGREASASAQQVASDHLDADELNSFAEGVAPEGARARYMQHLADCDTCRGLVVSLTQASGVAARYEVPEESRGLTFWQQLSALFAQPVWRYAVPAMILTTVIGIGLLALRQPRPNDFVAQSEPQSSAPSAVSTNTGAALVPTAEPQPKTQNGAPSGSPQGEETKARGFLKDEKNLPSSREELTPETTAPKVAFKDSPASGAGIASTESRPTDTLASKAAAPPPTPISGYDKSSELEKLETAKREDQDRARDQEFRVQKDDIHGPNRSRSNTTAAPASAQRSPVNGRGGPSNQMNKQANEPEARTVMGRHFTREDGAWVVTAYESSQAMIRVRRGSDQYRALVADEPGIRAIAEQLDGVVIVVWKGRAYRLQ